MRYGVIADVHANLQALTAVLDALARIGVDGHVFAGDLVGYGAEPNECIARVAQLDAVCVAGNHDLIVLDRLSDERCIELARASLRWTRGVLGADSRAFLAGLPLRASAAGGVEIAHGSLDDPQEYVTTPAAGAAQLAAVGAARALVLGHTHQPWAFARGRRSLPAPRRAALPEGEPLLLNPGAVGQSRELRARARFAVLDLDAGTASLHRVDYDVAASRQALRSAGLSPRSCHLRPSPPRAAYRAVRAAVRGILLCVAIALAGCTAFGEAETQAQGIRTPRPAAAPRHHCSTTVQPGARVQPAVDSLQPGETVCLRTATYSEDVTLRASGSRERPVTLRSAPGQRARIRGTLSIPRGAHDVVVEYLRLDGSASGGMPSPQINGTRVRLRHNDITNRHTGICVIVGGAFPDYGVAVDTVIDHNRIHDCGRLPRTQHDHGIYVEGARNTRIVDNLIYGNADWGVHLYPDADRSLVARNIIVANGSGVTVAGQRGGDEYDRTYASTRNIIEHNVIADSVAGHNLETSGQGAARGNVARRNCLGAAAAGSIGPVAALALRDNVDADPRFVDRAAGDLRLVSGSTCRRQRSGPRP